MAMKSPAVAGFFIVFLLILFFKIKKTSVIATAALCSVELQNVAVSDPPAKVLYGGQA